MKMWYNRNLMNNTRGKAEEKRQEMLERIKNFALYGDTDRESYNSIKDNIEEYNTVMSMLFASVASILIGVMLFLSYFQESFSGSKPVYMAGLILSMVQIFIAALAQKIPALSYFSVYMAISVFLLYGIAIATITRPEEQTVTFMVLLIFVPLIFVDRPIRMAISLVFYIDVYIYMALATKTGSILAVDLVDVAIFGILSIISETVVYRAKIQRYVLEHKLKLMSETDQLTGLKNRNCYELRLSQYAHQFRESLCCIYIDVNGLHELNNSKGHKAGDEMLCNVADAVTDMYGNKDAYRIGGDEYVVFVQDLPEKEIRDSLISLQDTISKQGYHIAVGYEYCEGSTPDMNVLITSAESKMYKNKKDYYEKSGKIPR